MTYFALGSTTGKCNVMGYWHTGNTPTQQPDDQIRSVDTLICTDACTQAVCGWDKTSTINNRSNHFRTIPIVDFGATGSLLTDNDYKYYKDLLMLPALAGGVVPVFNIPELTSASTTNPSVFLVLSRNTIADIFLGNSSEDY